MDMRSTRVRLLPRFQKLVKARICGAGLDSWNEVLRSFHCTEGEVPQLQKSFQDVGDARTAKDSCMI